MKKLLIIGAGGIAHAHVTAIKRIRGISIAGLCDVVSNRAKEFASEFKLDSQIFTAADEAISSLKPDYVLLLTPSDARLPIIHTCAKSGIPVFMEKPPCHDIKTGEEMLRIIEKTHLIHGVAFMSRYNESLNRVLPAIRKERLSMIAVAFLAPFSDKATAAKYPYPFLVSRSGGLVGDQGIHYIDVCRFIAASEVKSVRAIGVNQSLSRTEKITTCDTACWWLEMKNGVLVSHAHTWCADKWECRINIVTDKSDVIVDMFRNTASGHLAGKDFSFTGDQQDIQAFGIENRAFLEAVKTGAMSPVRSTFADALKSFKIVQEINRQIYK